MNKMLFFTVLFITTTANADDSFTSFAVGEYAGQQKYTNNLTLNKRLTILDADELEVNIVGKTEKCCDYITIYADKKFKFSGVIKKRLVVQGPSIKVIFKSDGRTTDKGVSVKITTRLPANIFNDIKKQLIVAITKILKYGTNNIYLKINRNLQTLKKLHATVKTTKEINLILNEVINELIVIGQTYKEIATMNSDIMRIHQQQFEIIENLKQETSYNIDKIQQKHQEYQTLLNDTQTNLKMLDDSVEKQKLTFSVNGYNAIMQTLVEQQQIWDKFYNEQETIANKLTNHSQKIKLLLHVLGINAQIYKQSANVALLRKPSVLKLDNLIDLPELQNIINDLGISETDILEQLEKIKQADL
ncbi:hypothetical protein QUF74_01925 [Candidatus Halobeggiatoa sp. HSG11]|nr:hypothetical protein [Candidatus Halobeggiatoa sp. HSG11]